jgi:hypothetical protein
MPAIHFKGPFQSENQKGCRNQRQPTRDVKPYKTGFHRLRRYESIDLDDAQYEKVRRDSTRDTYYRSH